jgi:hypothetical protein
VLRLPRRARQLLDLGQLRRRSPRQPRALRRPLIQPLEWRRRLLSRVKIPSGVAPKERDDLDTFIERNVKAVFKREPEHEIGSECLSDAIVQFPKGIAKLAVRVPGASEMSHAAGVADRRYEFRRGDRADRRLENRHFNPYSPEDIRGDQTALLRVVPAESRTQRRRNDMTTMGAGEDLLPVVEQREKHASDRIEPMRLQPRP